ncbi:MAG: outer membrane lipoprotein carrier protein LolA [Flavobacteriaceae bacterium]
MLKKGITLTFIVLAITFGYSQNSTKAKTLLDQVSAKMKTYENSYIEFKYSLDNDKEDLHQETKGNASLKGDLYSLNFMGATQIFDGKKIYTIMTDDEEINITDPDEEEDITPAKLFSFYKEGFTYEWDIVQNVQGRKIQYVKLIPIDSKSELKYVLLGIDSKTKNIYKIIQNINNGSKITINITKFKTNIEMSDKLFIFNRQKYEDGGYIINDL